MCYAKIFVLYKCLIIEINKEVIEDNYVFFTGGVYVRVTLSHYVYVIIDWNLHVLELCECECVWTGVNAEMSCNSQWRPMWNNFQDVVGDIAIVADSLSCIPRD